jgi:hypothetical protein
VAGDPLSSREGHRVAERWRFVVIGLCFFGGFTLTRHILSDPLLFPALAVRAVDRQYNFDKLYLCNTVFSRFIYLLLRITGL